jgi:hypothetical protein
MKGNMRLIGDGVVEHAVFTLDGAEGISSGKFPKSNALMILT